MHVKAVGACLEAFEIRAEFKTRCLLADGHGAETLPRSKGIDGGHLGGEIGRLSQEGH